MSVCASSQPENGKEFHSDPRNMGALKGAARECDSRVEFRRVRGYRTDFALFC